MKPLAKSPPNAPAREAADTMIAILKTSLATSSNSLADSPEDHIVALTLLVCRSGSRPGTSKGRGHIRSIPREHASPLTAGSTPPSARPSSTRTTTNPPKDLYMLHQQVLRRLTKPTNHKSSAQAYEAKHEYPGISAGVSNLQTSCVALPTVKESKFWGQSLYRRYWTAFPIGRKILFKGV